MRSLPYLACLDETFWRYFGLMFEKGYTEDNKIILSWVLYEEATAFEEEKTAKVWFKRAIAITDIDEMSDGDLIAMDISIRSEVFALIGAKLSDMIKASRNS